MTAETWIALLRGINVGRAKRVAMSDLRALLESLGYDEVRTLLQSGNAVFVTQRGNAERLARQISARIESDLGIDVKVLTRTAKELAAVVTANPFAASGAEPKELHVAFLGSTPKADRIEGLGHDVLPLGQFEVGERVIYLRLPRGMAGSNVPNWERMLGVDVTTRNWKTVSRLREMACG